VSQVGGVWTIGGQTFQTHNQTTIIGDPQVGDLVFVEGHLSEDGGRVADRIGLLRPAVVNRFTLTGAVEAMDAAVWTVAGQTILIDDQTTIEIGIASGDTVRLRGVILAGGSLLAQQIERVNDQPGFPFHFTGIVQNIQADTWLISGNSLTVDAETIVDDDIAVGDMVEVSGWILEDSTWLASRIVRVEDDLPEFSLSGLVQNSDPWRVAGISFATRDWTIIDPSIGAGDLVRVRGVILADGTWVASVIDKIDDDDDDDDDETIVLIGIVNSLNPWIVSGLQFMVTDDTVILGNIAVGDRVVVEIRLLADGRWQVMSIRPLTPTFGLGCFIINTVVTSVQPNQLLLQHWPAISLDDDDDDDFEIQGAIETNSVISLPVCIRFDFTIIIIGNIIVIYQPPVIIIAPPAGGNNNGGQFTPPPANNGSQFTPPSSNGNNNNNQNG
jgi:hypothetical protein